jgi:hypothetical protein
MPDTAPIPLVFLQELKLSLDDALRCINVHETNDTFDPQKAIGGIVRVRAELVNMLGNSAINGNSVCSTMRKEQGLSCSSI